MADDDCIIIPGGDPGAELLPVGRFKILLCGHQDIGAWIEAEEITPPLLGQMVGHHIKTFLGQAQPPALHAGCHHLEGLARTDTMGKQGIIPIEDVDHGIFLVVHQGDLRTHPHKADMGTVILPGPDAVKEFIVGLTDLLPPVHVRKDPFPELLPDHLLLLLGQQGLLFV